MGLVLREPLMYSYCCCFGFFFPYTFYSTPIAPVPTTSRQRSRALRHSECYSNIHAQETNYNNTRGVRDPYRITKAKQGNAGSHRQGHCRADPLFLCSTAGTPGFTPTYGCETCLQARHACLPLSSPFCFFSFLPSYLSFLHLSPEAVAGVVK